MPKKAARPSAVDVQELMTQLDPPPASTPKAEESIVGQGLDNASILKIGVAGAIFFDTIQRYGLSGAVKHKKRLAKSLIEDGKKLMDLIDDLS